MKKRTVLPVWILIALAVSACSGMLSSEQPPRQQYMLMPYEVSADADGDRDKPALALSISVVPGLDTDRILALAPDARLNHYANARWPDHLPEVLTSVLKRSLASSGRFSTVEASSRSAGDGWSAVLEVRQFYGIQNTAGSTSSVLVEISALLGCNDREESFLLSESSPVTEERLSVVVAAHQRGLDGVTRQLLDRIQQTCF